MLVIEMLVQVTQVSSGCHTDEDDSCSITIGTVPLRELAPDYKPPQDDSTAVVNQPLSSYPTNTPYPNPYPTSPVTQPQPYPNTSYPHPSPFPQNTPYPVPQPFPAGQPYPQPGGSPYPVPRGNPGIQTSGSPYPVPRADNAPYLPPCNPGVQMNNPPYPVPQPGGAPYPGGAPLKTGQFGFVAPGHDPANMPLLPDGAVPYPVS
jgi:hypothetical protein